MSDEERIARILGDWRERLDEGCAIDPEDVIREHPDLEEPLRARFHALALFTAAVAPVAISLAVAAAAAAVAVTRAGVSDKAASLLLRRSLNRISRTIFRSRHQASLRRRGSASSTSFVYKRRAIGAPAFFG